MKSKAFKPTPYQGQSLIQTVMLAVVSVFIYAVFIGVFKALFWPVRYLFLSDDQIYNEEKRAAKEKIRAREEMLKKVRASLDPTEDPEWFMAWRAGQVMDSRLLWVPDVYETSGLAGKSFNPVFLRYLEIQVDLHKHAGWANRVLFKRTLWKYYPEFTPDINLIEADIQAISGRVKAKELTAELSGELKKLGMSFQAIQYILKWKASPEEMARKVANIKAGRELGYSEGASVLIDEFGFEPDSEKARKIDRFIMETNVPAFISIAYLKEEIDKEGLDCLVKLYEDRLVRRDPSDDPQKYSEDTLKLMSKYLRIIKEEAAPKLKRAQMEQEFGKPVWELGSRYD